MCKRLSIGALCALGAVVALALGGSAVSAQVQPCDFVTGGGYVYPTGPATGAKGTLASAGGCKHGSDQGTPPITYWGHLEFHDKAADLKVHGTKITAYMVDTLIFPDSNARLICGTATTNRGDVDFVVRTKEAGGPGTFDEWDIQVHGGFDYSTFVGGPHQLGGGTNGGGNIKLHKPNNSTTGLFGGVCAALGPAQETFDLTVAVIEVGATGTVTSDSDHPGITCPGDCSEPVSPGDTIVLTAVVDEAYTGATASFAGCDTATQGPTAECTVTVTSDTTVLVVFSYPE